MAAEAAKGRTDRIKGSVDDVCGGIVPGGESEEFGGGVEAEAVFHHRLVTGLRDPGGRFLAGPEGPLAPRAGFSLFQSFGVGGFRLGIKLVGMAGLAGLASDELRVGGDNTENCSQ